MLRALDDQQPLERFLALKAEIKRLEEELAELQPLILSALYDEPEQRTTFRGVELSVGMRRTWAYSEAVEKLEDELKALKKHEERAGIAAVSRYTSYVITKAARPDQGS
jgi:hypothetical protein